MDGRRKKTIQHQGKKKKWLKEREEGKEGRNKRQSRASKGREGIKEYAEKRRVKYIQDIGRK